MQVEGGQSPPYANSSHSPPSRKRQRAKQACEPCRLRKRRCDGSMPCDMCLQFEYKCYYEKHSRKRSKLVEQHASNLANGEKEAAMSQLAASPIEARHSVEEIAKMRSMEANSGIAFTRLLGMRLDPAAGPKLFTFGWNLGMGYGNLPPAGPPVTKFLDQEQMLTFAHVYFKNISPIYGFLDKEWVMHGIDRRWKDASSCLVPDHILCGIAALGILFSGIDMTDIRSELVEAQRQALENSSTLRPPGLKDVQSWILRCLYLRAADHPHSVWVASCTTMHLIEAVGLQQEISTSVLHPGVTDGYDDPEIRSRTFWCARMLNSWVSFEYGRSRVSIRGITAALPTPRAGDYTVDYINLYGISCCLDPEQSDKAPQWEEFVAQIDSFDAPHPGIMLSKANLALCGYRRLRIANPNLSPQTMNKIIQMGLKGLEAAREMAEKKLCWWHVSNVPFQVVCVFLSMDVRESLCHLPVAMRTLQFVVDQFGTMAIKEVLKTARFLVRLSKKRKDEDSDALALILEKAPAEPNGPSETEEQLQQQTNGTSQSFPMQDTPMTATSEDWNFDILNNANFDWNFFLTAEMPAYNGVAPDGTM